MIIQSTRISRQGGVRYIARHLLDKTDVNERIEVLAGDRNALHDASALAKAKGCGYSLRHLSISPEREMTPRQLSEFLCALDAEFRIGPDRPRLIVRHLKDGRAHFHIAVAEVDPVTLRVLDCRNDYARLEDLARRYERDHGEHVQPARAERREQRIEGFSDIARKRAERHVPKFDRTKIKQAFAAGPDVFAREIRRQGLRIEDGDKGPILVNPSGTFVAAANRAAGVRQSEFLQFMERIENERLIGTQTPAPAATGLSSTQHHEASAAFEPAGDAGRAGPDCPTDGNPVIGARRAAAAGAGIQDAARQGRSPVPAIMRRRYCERYFLHRLGKLDLDDLLRRARELATWITSIFEPEAVRLSRRITEARQTRKSFPPADTKAQAPPTYDLRRRTP